MEFGKLGTYPNDQGGFTYDKFKNPLLVQGIWGSNFWLYRPSPMNPVTFATLDAAEAIAEVLRGKVVPDPNAANWNLFIRTNAGFVPYPSSAVYAIKLPGKALINAGYICDAMGNDVGFPTAARKSEAICADNGLAFDSRLADKLFDAFNVRNADAV